jgi:penicillin-binding protein-related factor A (putative recombinase)
MGTTLGKQAENKIKQWLNRPELGYSFDRIPDQMTGFYGSRNICDFICYKYPNLFYIESKATYEYRFDFSMISDYQYENLLIKSNIDGCYGLVIILFAIEQRCILLDINTIKSIIDKGKKSISITKSDNWRFPYAEIETISNTRKHYLDYRGDLLEYINKCKFRG